MTTSQSPARNVVVVDGSNIATEGRSLPSLAQLNEAVMAFKAEYPDTTVTVVVDATFGHRIAKSEVAEFDEAIAHNELVAPPAGAVGRGDAFVLSIANKVGARIFSNDSFQEFHGQYPWLFEDGRLIGGKPVPHVGWVFVDRVPVKGATSRRATREARGGGRGSSNGANRRTPSKAASQPMPVPTKPPPGARTARPKDAAPPPEAAPAAAAVPAAPSGSMPVNDLLPYIDFVEKHPVGTAVTGTVASYSSHGAYVAIGDVSGYVPLRLMATPAPRSARDVMKIGDEVELVVASYAAARRSVDLAVPTTSASTEPPAEPAPDAPTKRSRSTRSATSPAPAPSEPAAADEPASGKRARRSRSTASESAAADEPASGKRARRSRSAPSEPTGPSGPAGAEPAPPATPAPPHTEAAKRRSRAKQPAGEQAAMAAAEEPAAPAKRSRAKKAATAEPAAPAAPTKRAKKAATATATERAPATAPAGDPAPVDPAAPASAPAKRSRTKAAAAPAEPAVKQAPAKAAVKKAAAKAAVKKAAAKQAPAKAATKKAPAKRAAKGAAGGGDGS